MYSKRNDKYGKRSGDAKTFSIRKVNFLVSSEHTLHGDFVAQRKVFFLYSFRILYFGMLETRLYSIHIRH